jgi:L-ribulose-5-phosphate 3-epimerase
MSYMLNRRQLLTGMAAAAGAAQSTPRFRKSICSVAFPPKMPVAEKFAAAKANGFEGIELRMGDEIPVDSTPDDLARLADAAEKAGVTVVSLWDSSPLSKAPLNSPDPALRAKGVEAIRQAIDFAHKLHCEAILLYPGRVGSGARFDIGYQDTWDRFSAEIAKVVPDAERARVCLTMENVWNKFLLSPLEMRAFVDQFRSPWLQAHFDMGNVMQFGYPQDWILTLKSRIRRIHVKDYKLSARAEQGRFVPIFEGDVDFKGVMQALVTVDYRGFLSPEYGYDANDANYLKTLSEKLDRILAMA